MTRIAWKDKSFARTSGIDPARALEALEEIRNRDGHLTPAAIVKAAEPKDSPIHDCFEWRNAVAANRYREWQARCVARAVIEVPADGGRESPVYVPFRAVDDDGKKYSGYQRPVVLMEKPDQWLSTLGIFNEKLTSARASLEMLESLAGKSQDSDRLAKIALAAKSLDCARHALMQ